MERLSTTPFGQRPVTAGLLQAAAQMANTPALPHVDKWQILRELCVARTAFGVTDRELGVLEGLLSFHPEQMLGGNADTVVFPSNRALGERCHGMAESTLRRHLARLVDAGLILRHDSPNGKRYAARDHDGTLLRAFGFDLRPLLVRSAEIAQAAQAARAATARLKALREKVSLNKRDAQKLAAYGAEQGYPGPWDAILLELLDLSRLLRRRLSADELDGAGECASKLLQQTLIWLNKAENMSGKDNQSERQYQNSNTDSSVFEHCSEKSMEAGVPSPSHPESSGSSVDEGEGSLNIPLPLVLRALPEALAYAQEPVTRFSDLARLGAFLRGMIGISPSAWQDAVDTMGSDIAGIAVCCLVERIDDIRSPGGYIRSLTREAAEGRFSIARLIMALIQRPATRRGAEN